MSDPFSVTGSAVGIISLSLTVCQGIVQYYTAFKGQDEEVDHIVEKTSRLTDLLEVLQPRLESYRETRPVTVPKVEECLIACYGAIKKLERILEKCNQESASDGFREKLRTFARRTLFPFRRKTLQSLRDAVSDCQANLDTAINILQIDIQGTTLRGVSEISASNGTNSHNIMATRVCVEEIRSMMVGMVPMFTQLSMAQQHQTYLEPINARHRPDNTEVKANTRSSNTAQTPGTALCTCRPRMKRQTSQTRIGPVVLFREKKNSARHSEACPYYTSRDQEHQYGIRFLVGTTSRKWNIRAALNYNQAIGVFSVGPTLAFKAVVPRNNPAFQFINYSINCMELVDRLDHVLPSIMHIFRDGRASPMDMTQDGSTLLHAAFLSLINISPYIQFSDVKKIILQSFHKLVLDLIALGVPLDEVRPDKGHVLQIVVENMADRGRMYMEAFQKIYRDISTHPECFVDIEECFSVDSLLEKVNPQSNFNSEANGLLAILAIDENFSKGSGCNVLGQAILRQSLSHLDEILQHNPSALFHRNTFGHTALHLASDWLEGMNKLLQRGANAMVNSRDRKGLLPLDYAVARRNFAIVKLLLNAGSCIDWKTLRGAKSYWNDSCFPLLLHGLVERRERLKALAESKLPEKSMKMLNIPADYPMDGPCTIQVLETLRKAFVRIPEDLEFPGQDQLPKSSMKSFASSLRDLEYRRQDRYVCKKMDLPWLMSNLIEYSCTRTAKCIYEAGFRWDLYEWAKSNKRLLDIDMMLWLQRKGINVSNLNLHNCIDLSTYDERCGLFSQSERMNIYWEIFTLQTRFEHGCACSAEGCFPALTSIEKRSFQGIRSLEFAERCPNSTDTQFWAWVAPKMIRRFLFRQLELTHAWKCCMVEVLFRGLFPNREYIQEKQEEEWYLRSRLGPLVEELTPEYEQLDLPLSKFLEGRVRYRAQEVLEGEEEPSEEDKKRLREIGIVLEEEWA